VVGLMDHYGSVIGLLSRYRGRFAFFIEANLPRHLPLRLDSPLTARPPPCSPSCPIGGGHAVAFFVVTANAWMNSRKGLPRGERQGSGRQPVASPLHQQGDLAGKTTHMLLAAIM